MKSMANMDKVVFGDTLHATDYYNLEPKSDKNQIVKSILKTISRKK